MRYSLKRRQVLPVSVIKFFFQFCFRFESRFLGTFKQLEIKDKVSGF